MLLEYILGLQIIELTNNKTKRNIPKSQYGRGRIIR